MPCRKREKKKRKGVRVAPGKAAIVAVATKAIALAKVLAVQFGLGGFAPVACSWCDTPCQEHPENLFKH